LSVSEVLTGTKVVYGTTLTVSNYGVAYNNTILTITGLYYIVCYAENALGVTYGTTVLVAGEPGPIISNIYSLKKTATSIETMGSIITPNGAINEYGFLYLKADTYGLTQSSVIKAYYTEPRPANCGKVVYGTTINGSEFTSLARMKYIDGLVPNGHYYVVAYAKKSNGIIYYKTPNYDNPVIVGT
jgi:hypothetical protein